MNTMAVKKRFHFNNTTPVILPLMNDIISFIGSSLPNRQSKKTLINCRHIIIELLTNAVKHSGAEYSFIDIEISSDIKITKTDTGKPFFLEKYGHLPLHPSFVGEQIEIHKDDMFCIYANVISTSSLIFEYIEFPIYSSDQIREMFEHFGLLILLKSSKNFFYFIDGDDASNNFVATVEILSS